MIPGSNWYDDVPYGHLAFPQTHPDRLATIGRMFGLTPPPIDRCRVLELGCASGGNLIPMAVNLPDADFVRIDLSRRDRPRPGHDRRVEHAEPSLRHASILDVDEKSGGSSITSSATASSRGSSPTCRTRFLRSSTRIFPRIGVAYVSYNTYPGWHMRDGSGT